MAFSFRNRRSISDTRDVSARWLRVLLLEDWGLKLLALAITVGLWYAVTAQRAPATSREREVPLEFMLPEGIEVSNDPTKEIDLTLEGSRSKLAEINTRNLVARVDLSGLKPGDRVVRLDDRNVLMDLPAGVRIIDIAPRSVTLRLEPVIVREVEVEARFEGEPPEGFLVTDVQISPQTVHIRGPESRVNAVERVFTETIALVGRRESLPLPQTAINIPDRKIVPLESTVNVRVEIAERQIERRFANVGVRASQGGQVRPDTVTLIVRGPRSLVESLKPDEVRLVVESGPGDSITPRLVLPRGLEARIALVSVSPSEFTIER